MLVFALLRDVAIVRVRLPAGALTARKILELLGVFQPSAVSAKNSWQILGKFGRVLAAHGTKAAQLLAGCVPAFAHS